MIIKAYNRTSHEYDVMKLIQDEEGWEYANEKMAEKYKLALENSITYVAYDGDELLGFSRSMDDNGIYIYVCDLLVKPTKRGRGLGHKLMACIKIDYPDQTIYVMSDVDDYYSKLGFKREGSIFEIS